MAIYHCRVKIIGRNAALSAVAAAAYRAGESITNEWDGITYDYTQKHWIEYKEILLPANAPKEYQNRSTLWNAVEKAEKTHNAQLAREWECSLPHELDRKDQIEIVRQFVEENFVSKGLCVDYAIHDPPQRDDRGIPLDRNGAPTNDRSKMLFCNPHVHILAPIRPINAKGEWEQKVSIEYLCKRGEEEKGFSAAEFRKAKEEGWQKQYRYWEDGKKIYLTKREGEERGLERASKQPKVNLAGRRSEAMLYWSQKARMYEWRKSWEVAVNQKLAERGFSIRIDCRSLAEQGRGDEIPMIPEGVQAVHMDRKAERLLREGVSKDQVKFSEQGEINREIRAYNRSLRSFKDKMKELVKAAKTALEEIACTVELYRFRLIMNAYQSIKIEKKIKFFKARREQEENKRKSYHKEMGQIEHAMHRIKEEVLQIEEKIKACSPVKIREKASLQRAQSEKQKEMTSLEEYQKNVAVKYGFADRRDYASFVSEIHQKQAECERSMLTVSEIRERSQELLDDYKEEVASVPEQYKEELTARRREYRAEWAEDFKEELSQEETVDEALLLRCQREVDTQIDTIEEAINRRTDLQREHTSGMQQKKRVEEKHRSSGRRLR